MNGHNSSKAIVVKSHDEIMIMLDANQIVAETLILLQRMIAPGVTTLDLDRAVEDFVKVKMLYLHLRGIMGFPGSFVYVYKRRGSAWHSFSRT